MVVAMARAQICKHDLYDRIMRHEATSVAVYGMSDIGELIVEDILSHPNGLRILYGIDSRANEIYTYIPVYTIEEISDKPMPDVMIVSVLGEPGGIIKQELSRKFNCLVLSVEELVYE